MIEGSDFIDRNDDLEKPYTFSLHLLECINENTEARIVVGVVKYTTLYSNGKVRQG